MQKNTVITPNSRQYHLPHLGQRIMKTTLAVFICLLIYYLRGYYGQDMQTESVITAIICMQPYIRDTREYAVNRLVGSLIGAVLGLLFLFLMLVFPALGKNPFVLYALMAAGVLVALYTAVVLRMPDTSSLAAIVFICVVITFPHIKNPIQQAIIRIIDVFIGTTVAIVVNLFRLPRRKKRNLLFFIRAGDLAPDNFSHLSSTALFRLNYLYDDGANICLMTDHSPAFFIFQMSHTKVNTPLIVMGGAAIFDLVKSEYLWKETIPQDASEAILQYLDSMSLGYFVYTIHKNKTCIFQRGPLEGGARKVMDNMKRSHYRYYLEEEIYQPEEIVYIKIVYDQESENPAIHANLDALVLKYHLRIESRAQASAPESRGLYIYSGKATIADAQEKLLSLFRDNGRHLEPVEIRLTHGYQSDRDAIHLLNRVSHAYEPFVLLPDRQLPHQNA